METSSSFVSKAKTAFHSAAAKAEKVLTEIKEDLSTADHPEEIKDQSKKKSFKKLSLDLESISRKGDRELGRKQDWHDRFKNMRRGKKEVEKKEHSPNSSSNLSGLDENPDQRELGKSPGTKESEKGPPAEEENSIDMAKIPPVSVIRQLAVAVESGKKLKSMKDFLASTRDSSPVRERAGLSFSAMKSLVLRDKEDKSASEFGDDDEVMSFIKSLFDTEGQFCVRKNQLGSAMASVPRDIHAAPPESFVVRLSEIMGRFMTLRKMALFWWRVVEELRRLWSEEQPVPRVPLDENPDLNSCLLHQQLQVINCCISRKRRRVIDTETLDSVMREAGTNVGELTASPSSVSSGSILYARVTNGDLVLRLGADHPSEGLTMLETGEPVYAPVTQEGPLLTEDLIKETEEFVLRTGSVGAGCSQLLSDMQAFKAANPGCILEDFVRWHSPPDWSETNPDDETKDCCDGETTSRRGYLSTRMQKEGNLWQELWETSKPLPAVKQTPLFEEDLAVEGILNLLEDITPSELFQQLFVSLLASAFVIAEGPLSTNSNLSKLFYECKDYVVATCQNAKWIENIDDLCQVYGTVETILVHPEDGLKIINQSEENAAADEPKHRFKKLILKFSGKDRQFLRRQSSKNNQNQEENPSRQVFPNLFDGKSSLFSKKPPKPISTSQVDTSLFGDEMIGQVFQSCKYAI